MLKFLKYYDIQNRGEISLNEFIKAMEKIGLQVFSNEVVSLSHITLNRNFSMCSMLTTLTTMAVWTIRSSLR